MAARPVATTGALGGHHDDDQQDHDEGDDPEHLHPAWRAGGRTAVRPRTGVCTRVGVARRVSHYASAVVRGCRLLTEGAATGDLRDDVAPDELASYCLHALTAAGTLPSEAAVRRLVKVTLAGLRRDAGSS